MESSADLSQVFLLPEYLTDSIACFILKEDSNEMRFKAQVLDRLAWLRVKNASPVSQFQFCEFCIKVKFFSIGHVAVFNF